VCWSAPGCRASTRHARRSAYSDCPAADGTIAAGLESRRMKTFHCTHCQNLVFFENDRCLNCGYPLAYVAEQSGMVALEQGPDGLWRSASSHAGSNTYSLCANYWQQNVCNWAMQTGDPEPLCRSCRLTRIIPNLAPPGNKASWYRLETAKRRLIYSLLKLGLPVVKKTAHEPSGLQFEFLADSTEPNGDCRRVFTGHDNGLITINIAEADDVLREQQRKRQNEPYRTLLGHFRHESGHYYWDRLIENSPRLEAFRRIFGDERASYDQALKRHYAGGPPAQWEQRFISAYATMHPWEDWAETWAHFLHMTDALETASAVGLALKPGRSDEPSLSPPATPLTAQHDGFDRMIAEWLPLTYVMNNLSRGLGLPDSYPFVLSPTVVEKLRFIYDTVAGPA
jgi:hypothetical protein